MGQLPRDAARTLPADVESHLLHRLDDHGMNGVRRLRAGGYGAGALGIGKLVEERSGQQRTAGVVHAGEDDVIHSSPDRSRPDSVSVRE